MIAEVKELLRECSHRHDRLALIIQAITVALECRTGKLFFAEHLRIPNVRRPAIGSGHRFVEAAVGQGEPAGALVVKVGERALFGFAGGVFVGGDEAGVADGAS